jgi:hypothetical protein
MSKVTLTRLGSMINAVTAINGVLTEIESAFENTISRDGSAPNTMSGNLDANGNRILNLAAPVYDHEPARMADVESVLAAATGGSIPAGTFPTTILSTDPLNASNLTSGTVPDARMPDLTGDVTTSVGAVATTITNNVVTNAKLATMTQATIKGRASGAGTGNVTDLTGTQTTAILDAFTGDSGSGGVKGLVPAPASGDTARSFYLSSIGAWDRPHGHGVRQTVIFGVVNTSTGYPDVLPASVSSSLILTTQNISTSTPYLISAASGGDQYGPLDYHTQVVSNFSWPALTDNQAKIYLYYNPVTGVAGSTTLAPNYVYYTTPSTTSGQFTFNISEMKGYLGNGSTAPATPIVFVGECTTNSPAGSITSIIEYAYNGYYESAYVATLPGAGAITINHNIGVPDIRGDYIFECTTADGNYAIGDEIYRVNSIGTSYHMPISLWSTRLTGGFVAGVSATRYLVPNKTSGADLNLTAASWKYKLIFTRPW